MPASFPRDHDAAAIPPYPHPMRRRDFLSRTTLAAAASLAGDQAVAQRRLQAPLPRPAATPGRYGMLYPQQNQVHNVLDTSGLWQFQLDPREEGEARGWFVITERGADALPGMHGTPPEIRCVQPRPPAQDGRALPALAPVREVT